MSENRVDKEVLNTVKNIIQEELARHGYKVIDIILFGSRARGDAQPDSDWDFYVVVNKDIEFINKRKVIGDIQMRLAKKNIFCDIVINTQQKYLKLKDQIGTISDTTSLEGISLWKNM